MPVHGRLCNWMRRVRLVPSRQCMDSGGNSWCSGGGSGGVPSENAAAGRAADASWLCNLARVLRGLPGGASSPDRGHFLRIVATSPLAALRSCKTGRGYGFMLEKSDFTLFFVLVSKTRNGKKITARHSKPAVTSCNLFWGARPFAGSTLVIFSISDFLQMSRPVTQNPPTQSVKDFRNVTSVCNKSPRYVTRTLQLPRGS